MLSSDIKKQKPDWSIWDDGWVHRSTYDRKLIEFYRCPPGETPGETPQQMSDRVDRVIAKVREIHIKVSQALTRISEDLADALLHI